MEKESSMFELYATYFRGMRLQGLLPFQLDDPGSGILKEKRSTLWNIFSFFNFVHITLYCLKPCVLFWENRRTGYENETIRGGYLFQVIWMLGYFTIYPIFITFFFSTDSMFRLVSMWLRLDKRVAEILPENPWKLSRRVKFLRNQQRLYTAAWMISFLTFIPILTFVPRFPPLLNSVYMPHAWLLDSSRTLLELTLECFFTLMEIPTTTIAWGLLGGFDVLVSMMCRSILNIVDTLEAEYRRLEESREKVPPILISTYKSAQILTTEFNKVFAQLLFVQEFTTLVLSVFILYGALSGLDFLPQAFCFCNTFPLTLRMYVLYLPMSKLYIRSRDFASEVKAKSRGKILNAVGHVGGEKPSGKSLRLRPLMVKAWFFHKISPHSIIDYTLALVSYFVTLKQINN